MIMLKTILIVFQVVDMATVFEVVAILEKTPITPEILEVNFVTRTLKELKS